VVELGAGLGVVGFAIAESLQKYREHSRHTSAEQHSIFSNTLPRPDVVVLTDLEDVCDKLLNPNLSHKASLWSTRTDGQTVILPREWRSGSTPNQCGIVPPANERELATSVQVAIRPLAWGSMQHVESLIGTLMPYQNTNATLTIICSDLVRTFPIAGSRISIFEFLSFSGVLPPPPGTALTHSHSPNVSFAILVRHVVSALHHNIV